MQITTSSFAEMISQRGSVVNIPSSDLLVQFKSILDGALATKTDGSALQNSQAATLTTAQWLAVRNGLSSR